MSPAINPLVRDLASPHIPEAQGWARAYDGAMGPLINLSQAVPGSPPPPELLERLAAAAGAPETARYGAIEGDEPLREAYAADVSRLYGGRVDTGDVSITTGCNQAFFAAMMLLARAGDAVILPQPWYFNHQMTLDMLGLEIRGLPCLPERGFVPDVGEAEALIDERVRALVLVTPNNPTGAVYPPGVIEAFAAMCRRRGIWLVVDETYRDFMPAGVNRAHGLFADEGWREGVIQLYSFSKAYAIPGHRLGALVADAPIVAQLAKIMDSLQICAPRAGQTAVAWAVEALRGWREDNRLEINRRSHAFQDAMADAPGWRIDSIGAYFAYLRHPFDGVPATAVARALAERRGVSCLPGSYFGPGQDTHLRIAVANVAAEALEPLGQRLAGFTP
ncbi:aminotransferase [Salinarimonas soli]|uniref:Aminotransferase n=1 Tax=Salinarimonas soli TaxID=1638099 RepID=A0A5B2V9A2_9HYPH|nr:aminotransferase [Salinarimonas soli]KAA2235030.1 aminotransferase [Salinarimonas soli]